MALPAENSPWPPALLQNEDLGKFLDSWSAWYSGDPDELRAVYQGTGGGLQDINRPSQYKGGVTGAVARFWWGRPIINNSSAQREDQLHVPIAADLCQASADLLYAEPPDIMYPVQSTTGDGVSTQDPAQALIESYIEDGLFVDLSSGAEKGAALGGRYHRVTWDKISRPDGPFITTIDADCAIPEFRWGRLVGATFWTVLETDKTIFWRHIERHELDALGNGIAIHALYKGTQTSLGRRVDLLEHPHTQSLATQVDVNGVLIEGRTKGLLVEYIPNQAPQRRKQWRNHPIGRYLGRSDLDGIESEMDALDETYSSLMRDLRHAKSRIMIPEYMLQSNGPGRGAFFNMDQDVFVPIRSAAPEDGDATITLNQFSIRVADHLALAQELTEIILRSAGYSNQTFGENEDQGATTATEITSRERRTYLTRDRKVRLERPAVARLVRKMLSIDAVVFTKTGINGEPELPHVTFADAVQEAPLTLAQTAQALSVAGAASRETLIALVHPDWDEPKIKEEADKIANQSTPEAPVPFGV